MISAGSEWVQAVTTGSIPYINSYTNQPLCGMVRWNPNLSHLEVYDGTTWHMKTDNAVVDLSEDAKRILEWARLQKIQQEKIDQLMEKHPGLKDLHQRFEVMLRLVQEDKNPQ